MENNIQPLEKRKIPMFQQKYIKIKSKNFTKLEISEESTYVLKLTQLFIRLSAEY